MFCSSCGVNLPDDAIVCYKCASPTNLHFQNQPQQVQALGQQPRTHKTVIQEPRPIIVKSKSDIGAALVLLALLGCIGYYFWYQQNRSAKILGVEITDKGIVVSSDVVKNSRNYQTNSDVQNSGYSSANNTEEKISPSYSTISNVTTCQIANSKKYVYGHEHCDTQDCDNDESTSTYRIDVGDTVTLTGRKFGSSLDNVGSWIEVSAGNGTQLYVAETKLDCE